MHGSFLCASLEIGMLRRALMYTCELQQAQPRAPARLHVPRTGLPHPQPVLQQATLDEHTLRSSMLASDHGPASPTGHLPAGSSQAQAAGPASAKPRVQRNLTGQVFLHCARIDVGSLFIPPTLLYAFILTHLLIV